MDGPDSGTALSGGEEIYDSVLSLKAGDVLEEFGGLRDGERLEMFGLEETEEGIVPIGEVFDEPLGGGDDGEAGVFLDEGSQLFLSGAPRRWRRDFRSRPGVCENREQRGDGSRRTRGRRPV